MSTKTELEFLPLIETFFGICSLKCGCVCVALLGMVHPATFYLYYIYETEAYIDDICLCIGSVLTFVFILSSLGLLLGVLIDEKIMALIYTYVSVAFLALITLVLIVLIIRCIMQCRILMLILTIISLMFFYPFIVMYAMVANSFVAYKNELSEENTLNDLTSSVHNYRRYHN